MERPYGVNLDKVAASACLGERSEEIYSNKGKGRETGTGGTLSKTRMHLREVLD